MRFTEHFGIRRKKSHEWFDLELTLDTPLYVDPMLAFEDDNPFWSETKQDVTDFFLLAAEYVRRANGDHTSTHWAKAERMLMFPEPKEFALGLSLGHPEGSGTGRELATKMAGALDLLQNRNVSEVHYVELFVLFCDGLGVDRISDIFCNIAKDRFIKYTLGVAQEEGVPLSKVSVRHERWSRKSGTWHDGRIDLPESPSMANTGVLLAPERFLKDIPRVTPAGFWTWAEGNVAAVLRDDLNYTIGEAFDEATKTQRGRELARISPDIAVQYVDAKARERLVPYDVTEDPDLLVRWAEVGRAAALNAFELAVPTTEDDFRSFVADQLIESFRQQVEEADLWRVFWDDSHTMPRQEKIVQAVANSMWVAQCKAADVDISREANIGRGPVDFKFSRGWKLRALIEVKLIGSTKLFQGASKQLPQYLKSEQIALGYYLCVGMTDADFDEKRIERIEDTCASLTKQAEAKILPIYIDARPSTKKSASKL